MNRVIYGASEENADLLYASQFSAPDPFLYFESKSRSFLVLNQLEYDRGRREAKVDQVLNLSEVASDFKSKYRRSPRTAEWIAYLLKQYRTHQISVSATFPLGLGDELRRLGVKMDVAENGLFPERAIKREEEVRHVCNTLKVTAELIGYAIQILRSSKIGLQKQLIWRGTPLTSERIQAVIRMEAARRGYEALHPIVAGGIQGCDPHERGHGRLKAGELIILDIFPRNLKTGYWGDMTRTVIRGRASEAQRKQFFAVARAQEIAISKIRARMDASKIHQAVEQYFKSQGYSTNQASGFYEGFFHGTGHGLGLEIHEPPRISSGTDRLKIGNVVTVEPGLYYRVVGGVRIEDVVLVEKKGCRKLSRFPTFLEIH